eukprot:GEMP01050923.1.p1 GENE.GEMP01050923.1~~GEMP01050923.1.p1  ORF type:complete len:407 (+),score=53.21 GEMP01050923.1:38-1258(+)
MKCAVILVTGPPGAGKSIWVREVVKTLESPVGVIRHCHAKCFQLETAPKPDVEFYAQVYDFGSGCICCTPDGDLIRLLDSVPTLRYLVLETTGLADPRPFLRVFLEEPRILTSYHLQGVVCLIDTRRWRSIEEDIRDGTQYSVDCDVLIGRVKDQLHYADICYLHPPGDLNDTARATLARIYPDLHFSTTRLGEVLRLPECYRPKSKIDSIPIPDMIVHDRTFSTHCVCRCDADIDADILLAQLYQQLTDGEILRVQGFVSVGGTSVADNVISPILLIDGTGPYPTTMRVAPYCVQGNSADVHGTLLDGAWEARTLTGVATKLFFCGSGWQKTWNPSTASRRWVSMSRCCLRRKLRTLEPSFAHIQKDRHLHLRQICRRRCVSPPTGYGHYRRRFYRSSWKPHHAK